MGARNIAVATKVSDPELTALLVACERSGSTKSHYIAEAIAERLMREKYLKPEPVVADEPPPCPHKNVQTFTWGKRCKDCNMVLTGRHAAG